MEQMLRMNIYILSFSILVIILVRVASSHERRELSSRLFVGTLAGIMFQMLWDMLTWLIEPYHSLAAANMNRFLNVFIYGFNVLPSMLFVLYVNDFLYGSRARLRQLILLMAPVFAVLLAASIATPWTGWMFTISDDNRYERNIGFKIIFAASIGLALFSTLLLLMNRRRLQAGTFSAMILFIIIPLGCAVVQAAQYGTVLIYPGMVLGFVILYLNIQGEQVKTDWLTGLYNRRELDRELQRRLRACSTGIRFGAVMIDLDGFKQINDVFGHEAGDVALRRISEILKKCFHYDDFIARFGGDEFVVLLDVENETELEAAVARLVRLGRREASRPDREWQLQFSVGSALCDADCRDTPEATLARVDADMFRNKTLRRANRQEAVKQNASTSGG